MPPAELVKVWGRMALAGIIDEQISVKFDPWSLPPHPVQQRACIAVSQSHSKDTSGKLMGGGG